MSVRNIRFIIFLVLIPMLSACIDKEKEESKFIKNALNKMVFIQGGTYLMGDVGADIKNKNGEIIHLPWSTSNRAKFIHKVKLDSFWISKYEITYKEYDVFSDLTGKEKIHKRFMTSMSDRNPNFPAGVSWYQANDYCQWLSQVSGLPFSLPTEAQWEYVARDRGKPIGFATNNGKIERGVNYMGRNDNDLDIVGRYPPNPLGIYDLSGNATEWVKDWYDKDYYKHSPVNNPQGPETGKLKGVRFGDHVTTIYARGDREPDQEYFTIGFRCVVNAEKLD